MKFEKFITPLVISIIILSIIAAGTGIFSAGDAGKYSYESIRGEKIEIYGEGLYQEDSIAIAAQAIAQDYVTLLLGIPVLIVSLYLAKKGLIKGRLLLTGTIGYFLYTYISYTFLSMYNSYFLIYVTLMSVSFFSFILCIMSFQIDELKDCFKENIPVKFLGGFLIFISFTVGMLWLGNIIQSLIKGTIPPGLDHYTTLVIQALDLGFIVPLGILSGILIISRKSFGYLLSSVFIIKMITMLSSISAMIIGQIKAGISVSIVEIVMFPLFNIFAIFCLIIIMINIKEPLKFKEVN